MKENNYVWLYYVPMILIFLLSFTVGYYTHSDKNSKEDKGIIVSTTTNVYDLLIDVNLPTNTNSEFRCYDSISPSYLGIFNYTLVGYWDTETEYTSKQSSDFKVR